ncbi:CLUMA_CG012084, isoform A [Clunio marinus]|uniref:CLUMA_CG012084, isoform A n=1 Tax=Clunio marinus TaxID=568069 RepID=A0A1J1IFH7_9DIPT|nr:CLUMA_CG012084, isoform A [Clunio marinus]
MNYRLISVIVIISCSLFKVLGFFGVYLLLSCIIVAILTVLSVILSISPKNDEKIITSIKHPLDQLVTKQLGLNFDINNQTRSGNESLENLNKGSRNRFHNLSGHKKIDEIIHNILDNIFRDFVESWYKQLSNDKDFPSGSRKAVEKAIESLTTRLRQAPLLTTLTTKMVDDVAAHIKCFNHAQRTLSETKKAPVIPTSRFNSPFHRRNKSDTDVANSRNWKLGNALIQKKVANSTFYSVQTDEKLMDPDSQLLELFFSNSNNNFKEESLNDEALEKHLIAVIETALYFTLQPEDFKCDITRSFLSTILACVVGKAVTNTLSDPDFLNFQIAHLFINDPPSSEFLIRMIRQCSDLSELRAVRHMITREMDVKHRDPKYVGELASLKYTQKIIDLRISSLQNQNIDSSGKKVFENEKFTSKLPLLTLDEILSKDLALSYYLDYLSIMNLQKYVIFYCLAQDWKATAADKLSETIDVKEKQTLYKLFRDKAFNLYTEYLLPTSSNYLNVDQGLIEVLHIKIKDTFIQPDPLWFESICKFVYEKLKNEHVFLQNFYESPAYKKLLLELEETECEPSIDLTLSENKETKSDTSSGDFVIDDEMDFLDPTDEVTFNLSPSRHQRSHSDTGILLARQSTNIVAPRLTAKIINTAINSSGNFAVYAINVNMIEKDSNGVEHQKSWHIYRRYSKFLEMKKLLLRKFPKLQTAQLPFPKKQTFHNTNRSLIERRMVILNEFLKVICQKADTDDAMHYVILDFLEPDQDDREIHGTKVTKHIVNPLKSGMRTIRNMPDSFIGGLSRIFLSKNIEKFALADDEIDTQSSSEFPALISFVNLLDVVFDLDGRSQWLKKGIQSFIAAPFISQSINKRILDIAQKYILDVEKVEDVLCGILNNVWPNGIRQDPLQREDTTKLRTRMAAKVALFAFLSDDLKHFLGSETTRIGLTNFFEMLQNQTLNRRLILVLMHRLCTTIFPTTSMTKHVIK